MSHGRAPKKWARFYKFIVLLIVAVAVVSCLERKQILQNTMGVSKTGGTRTGSIDQIQFGFDGQPQRDGLPTPWQSRVIVGKLQTQIVDDPAQGKAIHITCDRSHCVLGYQAVPFDPRQYPVLSWSWKAMVLPPRADTRTHSATPIFGDNRNDKALQVMIEFDGDYVLNYVWDSNAPVGYECDEWSPIATVKTQVVDSGTAHLNQWVEHRINVVEDFKRRYGKMPGNVLGVSISANTNNTAALGDGMVSMIAANAK